MSLEEMGFLHSEQTKMAEKSCPQPLCRSRIGGLPSESHLSPQAIMTSMGLYRSRPISVKRYSKRTPAL